jgi:hypothetical protein
MVSNKQPKALMLALGLESNGEGCSCHAYGACECACDASWSEFYVKDAAAELRRLHAENEQLKAALRRVIRTYMVADDAWDHDAELERLYQREVLK